MYKNQRTVEGIITFKGIGLHTGKNTNLKLIPAKEDTGIIFIKKKNKTKIEIKAIVENVVSTDRGTTIGLGKNRIHTVEHLLSAIYALGINNIYIEIDNDEPPIFDGSSDEYYNKILNAGVRKYNKLNEVITIDKPIYFLDSKNNIEMSVLPSKEFKITFDVNYNYGNIGRQSYTLNTIFDYQNEICKARTFCSIKELSFLKERGLIKGGSLESGIVFLDNRINKDEINKISKLLNLKVENFKNKNIINSVKLRYEDEPVRHKILDLIGDFVLLGKQIRAHIISKNGGHTSNIEFIKKIKKEMKSKNIEYKFNKEQIKQVIPHREPFLLIDKVVNINPGKNVTAIKTITKDDIYLQGHFPNNPIMPGVLIIECMAQASCFLSLNLVDDRENKMMLLSTIKSAKFYKKVLLNDEMKIKVELKKFKLNTALFYGEVEVCNEKVTTAEFMATVIKKV